MGAWLAEPVLAAKAPHRPSAEETARRLPSVDETARPPSGHETAQPRSAMEMPGAPSRLAEARQRGLDLQRSVSASHHLHQLAASNQPQKTPPCGPPSGLQQRGHGDTRSRLLVERTATRLSMHHFHDITSHLSCAYEPQPDRLPPIQRPDDAGEMEHRPRLTNSTTALMQTCIRTRAPRHVRTYS